MTSAKLAVAGLRIVCPFHLVSKLILLINKHNFAFVKIKWEGVLATNNRGSWNPLKLEGGVSKCSEKTLELVC